MFSGVSEINLDAKGRMAMPTRYRERIADRCDGKMFVTVDPFDQCLTLHTLPEWEIVQQKLNSVPSFDPATRRLKRLVIGHASEVDMDGSGRLLLPAPLRDFAEIERRIVLLGQGNKFEIWSERLWHQTRDAYLDVSEGAGLVPNDLKTLSL
ncbi:transcriptional regulator MraZ [Motiliproteus coralliicola]|uniref:Transcriptional regulator MraZ n=1 Tax=Motiliproteus coralliicola TaxID=2283196 RepID=A0A369WQ90_9GAMM|nr:division/cell wall cluster transcriptional repressor MraZ [Motiliproteus coralliicola]RDE22784.1 transcriptional regulator MraZ [Motiliproteus coralliicola]